MQVSGQWQLITDVTGVGTLTLTFNPNIPDEDKDLSAPATNCSATFFSSRSGITETFHIVAVKSNTQFYLMGKDDFFSPTLAEPANDFPAVTGECTLQ